MDRIDAGSAASKVVSTTTISVVTYYKQMGSLTDPFIWLVMVLGGFLSVLGVLYDYYHSEDTYTFGKLWTELIKGLIAGVLVATLLFIGLMENGNNLLHYLSPELTITNALVWFVISLIMSIGALDIVDAIISIPKKLAKWLGDKFGG